jgi:hypothetical protein
MCSYVACVGATLVHLVCIHHVIRRSIRVVVGTSVGGGLSSDCTVFRRRLCLPAAVGGAVQILDYFRDVVFFDSRRLV